MTGHFQSSNAAGYATGSVYCVNHCLKLDLFMIYLLCLLLTLVVSHPMGHLESLQGWLSSRLMFHTPGWSEVVISYVNFSLCFSESLIFSVVWM